MATYKTLPQMEDLKPGIDVFEFNVLVLPREIEEKTSGGVIMPDMARERDEEAGVEGMIVSAGQFAFSWEDGNGKVSQWENKPETGQIAMFARYAGGRNFIGADGRRYRIMKDKDILGVRHDS